MADAKEHDEAYFDESPAEMDDEQFDEIDQSESQFKKEAESMVVEKLSGQTEGKSEGGDLPSTQAEAVSPKRGARLRKEMLKKFPLVDYPDTLQSKNLELESWLSSILNLKVIEFLESLEQVISRKEN